MRRLATALVLAALALAGAAAPAAVAQDNTAIAINTKDDASLFKLAFAIKQVSGDVVDQTNAAIAYASCERCQTVAIAIQVLIVMAEDPSVIVPTNLAVAINEDCPSCTTMALAYQFVIGKGGPVRLTAEGRREIARIRRELRKLRGAGLSPEDLAARVDELVGRLREVLANELVARGRGVGQEADEDGPEEDADEGYGQAPDETSPDEPAPQPAPQPGEAPSEEAPQTTTPEGEQPPGPDPAPEPAPGSGDGAGTAP